MDPYAEYHYHYRHHHQQQQILQTFDPSQSYDQALAYNQQYPYHHNYSQYYYTNDLNYHQQQQQYQYHNEPNSIHPPGVPVQPDPTHQQYALYYPQTQVTTPNVDTAVPLLTQPTEITQTPYSGAGNTRGRTSFRGAGRGPKSHGLIPFDRSRGRARSSNAASNSVAFKRASGSQKPDATASVCPPARISWCELCRVDCNTAEILEQHKNGKKHKKNLKFQEDLQKQNKIQASVPSEQVLNSGPQPQPSNNTKKDESSEEKKLPEEVSAVHSAANDNNSADNTDMDTAEKTEILTQNSRMNNLMPPGQGVKRGARGGRGGKVMKTHDGSRRPVEAPKTKEVIPLICEMCNAKCESPIVFDSHLKGKRHLANLKRFQDEQEAALQSLYPALQALYPTLQALCQLNYRTLAPFTPQLEQSTHGSLSVIEPGSSVFSQGQSSASGPSAQDEPLQFNRVTDVPIDGSGIASQSTLTGANQCSLDKESTDAVGIPNSEFLPTDQASLPITEGKLEKPSSDSISNEATM